MTGELTLRGRVLGVGGLKEKILAARQHGIKTVLLPQENYDDVFDVKKELGTDVELVFVRTMDDSVITFAAQCCSAHVSVGGSAGSRSGRQERRDP